MSVRPCLQEDSYSPGFQWPVIQTYYQKILQSVPIIFKKSLFIDRTVRWSLTEDVLEVLAPRDEELNPDGDRGSVPRQAPTGDARRSDRRARKRKSCWDQAPEGGKTVVIKPPSHWKEMRYYCSGDNDWHKLLQKILFADAVCGTHTPYRHLAEILNLF